VYNADEWIGVPGDDNRGTSPVTVAYVHIARSLLISSIGLQMTHRREARFGSYRVVGRTLVSFVFSLSLLDTHEWALSMVVVPRKEGDTDQPPRTPTMHLAYPASSNEQVSDDVSALGLRLLKASPSGVSFSGCFPNRTFALVMNQALLGQRVGTALVGREVEFDSYVTMGKPHDNHLIPLRLPDTCVTYVKVTSTIIETLQALGYRTVKRGAKTIYVVTTPTPEDIRRLMTTDPDKDAPTFYQTMNINTYIRFSTAWRVLSVFTCMQNPFPMNNDYVLDSQPMQITPSSSSSTSQTTTQTSPNAELKSGLRYALAFTYT